MNRQGHWDKVYETKGDDEVSWYEAVPGPSLDMLAAAGLRPDWCVLDVGGGNSRLVECLAARGLDCLAVLDVSGASLAATRERMGPAAAVPIWIEADVTGEWSLKPMDAWHDRAVFHFLTTPADRARYRAHMQSVVKPGGVAIVATFAPDGPATCSGLPVARYAPEALAAELGRDFVLVESRRHEHHTPWGTTQPFQYSRFRRA
ncbi:MAG: class I SAM-dependent methyltransferase [Vicinamibacterales bacterium]